jgi:hypothetical protein
VQEKTEYPERYNQTTIQLFPANILKLDHHYEEESCVPLSCKKNPRKYTSNGKRQAAKRRKNSLIACGRTMVNWSGCPARMRLDLAGVRDFEPDASLQEEGGVMAEDPEMVVVWNGGDARMDRWRRPGERLERLSTASSAAVMIQREFGQKLSCIAPSHSARGGWNVRCGVFWKP